MNKKLLIAVVLIVVLGLGWNALRSGGAIGGAGLVSNLQSATTTEIGPDLNTELFAANNFCRARVISTLGTTGAMIIFGDTFNGNISSTTLSGVIGHWQGASTTVTYSSDDVGCGNVFGYSGASSTITISEF